MHRSRGFTLVEALVAVTLMALLLGALMPVFQQGLAVMRSGDRHSRAVLLAQSILDRELALGNAQERPSTQESPSQGTASQGEGQEYQWQVTRTPFVDEQAAASSGESGLQSATSESSEAGPFNLVEVSVVVRWPENEFGVQLHSLVLERVQ